MGEKTIEIKQFALFSYSSQYIQVMTMDKQTQVMAVRIARG
jgi:hypothetical protein